MSDRRLTPYDWVVVVYSAGVAILILATHARVPDWWLYAGVHAAVAASCIGMALWNPRNRLLSFLHDWDVAVYIPVLFFMTCVLAHRVHPVDYDAQLIAIDRRIGGIAVLKWMEKIQTSALTTASKSVWIAYYFLTLVPGIPLYLRRRSGFLEAKLLVVLSFLVSYAGYFALPAQGPGYFQQEIGVAQPRFEESKVASSMKRTIYELEGEARDTFPSGHVMIAAMTIVLLVRNRLWRTCLIGVPFALGVIWSTMYLRYHYLIDGIAGLALVALIAWLAPKWQRRACQPALFMRASPPS
ncbi:MAG: phosphatase PAP2 family protein [Planctomycetes bacterium]|nr:phosphatase PAP2 family protein [Planctomycetota bacterium]